MSSSLAEQPPALASMEEPLGLMAEPQDEVQRQALDPGGFTGIYVQDARQTLDSLLEEPDGVLVERLVENSAGAAAGLEPGDLLLEVDAPSPEGGTHKVELHWPSQWREVELASHEGDQLHLLTDRAGAEREVVLTVQRRLAPSERDQGERIREERRTGVVLRTATEVEARAAGLAPGGGAVVVGLSHDSPWREVGVVFEDLIASVDGKPVAHPSQVVAAILDAKEDGHLALDVVRKGERVQIDAPVSRRARELKSIHVPILFSYERERERSETSVLFGLFGLERTSAAWKMRLLWFITFGGGDADKLVEVEG
jgi:S1-C subfamily serine protease